MASDAVPIKTEESDNPPDVAEPVDDVEEDDAGDLEFYDKEADPNSEKLWLARVPKYVWQSWHKMTENLGMDDEVQIGTLRTWTEHAPDGTDKTHLRMLLNKEIPEHQLLPKEYDLEVTDREVKNHYVFSEKDTEKYRDQNKLRKAMQDQMIPMSARQPKTEANKVEKPRRFDRRTRFQPFYRKAVPST
jgi:transcription initiation factor TFIIF subunit beta